MLDLHLRGGRPGIDLLGSWPVVSEPNKKSIVQQKTNDPEELTTINSGSYFPKIQTGRHRKHADGLSWAVRVFWMIPQSDGTQGCSRHAATATLRHRCGYLVRGMVRFSSLGMHWSRGNYLGGDPATHATKWVLAAPQNRVLSERVYGNRHTTGRLTLDLRSADIITCWFRRTISFLFLHRVIVAYLWLRTTHRRRPVPIPVRPGAFGRQGEKPPRQSTCPGESVSRENPPGLLVQHPTSFSPLGQSARTNSGLLTLIKASRTCLGRPYIPILWHWSTK